MVVLFREKLSSEERMIPHVLGSTAADEKKLAWIDLLKLSPLLMPIEYLMNKFLWQLF